MSLWTLALTAPVIALLLLSARAAAATFQVSIDPRPTAGCPDSNTSTSYCYKPGLMLVLPGDSVQWEDSTGANHNVRVWPDGTTGTDPLSAYVPANSASAPFTFHHLGKYIYYCTIHGYSAMHAEIDVVDHVNGPGPPTVLVSPSAPPPASNQVPAVAPTATKAAPVTQPLPPPTAPASSPPSPSPSPSPTPTPGPTPAASPSPGDTPSPEATSPVPSPSPAAAVVRSGVAGSGGRGGLPLILAIAALGAVGAAGGAGSYWWMRRRTAGATAPPELLPPGELLPPSGPLPPPVSQP